MHVRVISVVYKTCRRDSSLHSLEQSCCLNLQFYYHSDLEIADKHDIVIVSQSSTQKFPKSRSCVETGFIGSSK